LATGGTQQSNRDDESERLRRTGGVVSIRREVDTPANKRRCHNKRHGEEEEDADAMATMEEDAAGVGTVAAGGRMRTMRLSRGLRGTTRVGGVS
jgi:hypothetical protein